MSLQSFLAVVEADAKALWGDVEGAIEQGAVELWDLAKPVFGAVEAEIAGDLRAAIAAVLANPANVGADLATLEAAVLNHLEEAGSALLPKAQSVGSTLLQVIIGLVLHAV